MKPMNRLPSELEGEVTIRVVDDMPIASPGFVIYDETGHCNVYLNGRYNHESNMQTADHELRHILNDDFFNDDDIRTVEARADDHTTTRKTMPVLKKASELLPLTPVDKRQHAKLLSPHQSAVLIRAISELDRFAFSDDP